MSVSPDPRLAEPKSRTSRLLYLASYRRNWRWGAAGSRQRTTQQGRRSRCCSSLTNVFLLPQRRRTVPQCRAAAPHNLTPESAGQGVFGRLVCRAGLARLTLHPHTCTIAPSVSSLAATESSSCSRSDAEHVHANHPTARSVRTARRIAAVLMQATEAEKLAHAQFGKPRCAAGARPVLSLFRR